MLQYVAYKIQLKVQKISSCLTSSESPDSSCILQIVMDEMGTSYENRPGGSGIRYVFSKQNKGKIISFYLISKNNNRHFVCCLILFMYFVFLAWHCIHVYWINISKNKIISKYHPYDYSVEIKDENFSDLYYIIILYLELLIYDKYQ